jgi:DNA topoisomerase-1
VTDREPGLRRVGSGRVVRYASADGRRLRDKRQLRRIRALAIPPAWTEVWICADPEGHIQATGRDARGRKQYRYHRRWIEARGENKFSRMVAYGLALPRIRRRLDLDLRSPGLGRQKVLATVVRLLDLSGRIGRP